MGNKRTLIDDFTRVSVRDDVTVLELALVRWAGPHTPQLEVAALSQVAATPTPHQVSRALEEALASRRFFQKCTRCEELSNGGHMHDAAVCQGCVERHFGVIH